MAACPGLALSTGSACAATSVEPSHVLRAIGLPEPLAGATLRIGLGRGTTQAEVDLAIETLTAAVERESVTTAGAAPI
jgi:cysteine desulfurase